MNYEPVTLLTSALATNDFHSNFERTNELRLELINMGLSFTGVKINGLQGFLVVTEDYQPLRKLALKHNQTHIVFSDNNRQAYKISCVEEQPLIPLGMLLKMTTHVNMSLGEVKITFTENGTQHVYTTEK